MSRHRSNPALMRRGYQKQVQGIDIGRVDAANAVPLSIRDQRLARERIEFAMRHCTNGSVTIGIEVAEYCLSRLAPREVEPEEKSDDGPIG